MKQGDDFRETGSGNRFGKQGWRAGSSNALLLLGFGIPFGARIGSVNQGQFWVAAPHDQTQTQCLVNLTFEMSKLGEGLSPRPDFRERGRTQVGSGFRQFELRCREIMNLSSVFDVFAPQIGALPARVGCFRPRLSCGGEEGMGGTQSKLRSFHHHQDVYEEFTASIQEIALPRSLGCRA